MNGYEVYCQYIAIKTHFTSPSYDYFQYHGKIRSANPDAFERRRDKYKFHKLARSLNDRDVVPFLVSNFVHNDHMWTGDLLHEDAQVCYREWMRRTQSLPYIFEQEFLKVLDDGNRTIRDALKVPEDGTYPVLLIMFMNHEVCSETMIIMHDLGRCFDLWHDKINDTVIYPKIEFRLLKYKSFVDYDHVMMKEIAKRVLTAA